MTSQNGFRNNILQLIAEQRTRMDSTQKELENLRDVIKSLETTLRVYDEAHSSTISKHEFIISANDLYNANVSKLSDALKYIAKHSKDGIVRYSAAKDIIMAAGLSRGKPRNVASQLHRIMTESDEWEKVGRGEFLLKNEVAKPAPQGEFLSTGQYGLGAAQMMECPVCRRTFDNSMNVARHMMTMFDESHIEWIEANGLNAAELVKVGNYKALADLLEKGAKTK